MGINDIKYYGITDKGIKKAINQDSLFGDVEWINNRPLGIFAVADGMGGYAQGEVASQFTIECIKNSWKDIKELYYKKPHGNHLVEVSRVIEHGINAANHKIIDYAMKNSIEIGTTISIIFMINNDFLVKHIGDSRIYRINSKGSKILTKDHSWVAEQVEKGNLSIKEAKNHRKRHILTECLGFKSHIKTYTNEGKIESEGIYLLASDGFYNRLYDNEIIDMSNIKKEALHKLVERVKERGESDNISCLVVKPIVGNDEKTDNQTKGIKKFINKFLRN